MSETLIQHTIKTAGTLIAFALVGTAMLAYVFIITQEPIALSEEKARLALFKQILPENTYDNNVLKDELIIGPSKLLGNTLPTKANIAKRGNKTIGVILEAVAHDGYAGDIKLLIAIRADATISGVRVLTHKETPGLGDYIDIIHSDWIKQFNNESFIKTPAQQWKVTKDGGNFEFMAGATITPRAVIKAISKALQYFEENKQSLLNAQNAKKMSESKEPA